MSFLANPPPSVMAKKVKEEIQEEGEEEDGPKKQSREDWKKMKELEEARKAGTAPAMKDEEGKDINPHIPQYIMQAPWYFGSQQPTLRHQRQQEEKLASYARMNEWYKRGVKDGPVVTKYRKGACENCGAMTHKKKDCLERPRKIGAKFTGTNIAPDEHIQVQLSHDFDGKRDRWNGYDPEEHQMKLQDDYLKMEEAKRILKEASLETGLKRMEEMDDKADRDSDDERYAEEMDMPGQKFETKQRITVRNLRIREDTAKYLFNLDVNSAFYDPKTRSMRENPFQKTGKEALETKFAGDNFVRASGDAMDMAQAQVFAWDAYERGVDVQLQADPTKLELLKKEFHNRQDNYKETVRSSILDKYGGQEYLQTELPVAQSENYVEYSRHGTVIKGQEKAPVKSRYEEDVFPNNHTSVWGSYWKDGKWGFHCCHSLVRESYCTGEAGKRAYDEDVALAITETAANPEEVEEPQSLMEQHQKKLEEKKKSKNKKKKDKKKKSKKRKRRHSSSSDDSSDDSDSDSEKEEKRKQKRLKKALKNEDKHRAHVDKLMNMDERQRPYNSMYEVRAPTEEEMEAFRMKQVHSEDPMAHF